MAQVEKIRLRHGMSKTALAAELETTTDAVCALDGRAHRWQEGDRC